MKCPECGQWNSSSEERCTGCGAELTSEAQEAITEKIKDAQEGKEIAHLRHPHDIGANRKHQCRVRVCPGQEGVESRR